MAGGPTRYRTAHAAGARGAELPPTLASRADTDPLIDQAHDAGRSGVSYDDFARDNGLAPTPKAPAPSPRIRRSARTTPTLADPTGGRLPIGFGSSFSLAGAFFGAIAYALILSVADYGAKGPGLWFKAKFLNEPAPAPAAK